MVFPVPGGPCNKTPFGASIPSLSKSSGCFNGSSIISLTFDIAGLMPPRSSYITLGMVCSGGSSTASGRSSTSVISVILIIPVGDVETTCILISPSPNEGPKKSWKKSSNISPVPKLSFGLRTLVVEMKSPFETVLFIKEALSASPGAYMRIPLMTGARVTCFASFQSAFVTSTYSPMLVFAFERISPSILTMSRPSSGGYARPTIADVVCSPFNSTTSNTLSPSCSL